MKLNNRKKSYINFWIVIIILGILSISNSGEVRSQELDSSLPEEIRIENSHFNIKFSSRDGYILSYRANHSKFNDDIMEMAIFPLKEPFNIKIGDLVPLIKEVNQREFSDNDISYQVVEIIQQPQAFSKVEIKREFLISDQKVIKYNIKFKNNGEEPVYLPPYSINGPGPVGGLSQQDISKGRGVSYQDMIMISTAAGLEKFNPKKPSMIEEINSSLNWLAVKNQLYTVVLNPLNQQLSKIRLETGEQEISEGYSFQAELIGEGFTLESGEVKTLDFELVIWPLVYSDMAELGYGEICEYSTLNLMILSSIKFFHSYTGSWGFSIFLLTLMIKLILYPLGIKQNKSMMKMQKLQPIIEKLKIIHKDNPQKLNTEVMKIYQEFKVNPLGGCLPLLIQLPIIFALFGTLRSSVEIKKESFLWLADLAHVDRTYVLPIAITIAMYFQQKMMMKPSSGNKPAQQQQTMMKIMPIIMFVFAINLPSGVLIYWFTFNVLQIVQQKLNSKDKELEQIDESVEYLLKTLEKQAGKKKKAGELA